MKISKTIIIISIIILAVSILLGYFVFDKKTYPEIKKNSSQMDIQVYALKHRKGFLIINDSLTINGEFLGYESNTGRTYKLKTISAPYRMIKNSKGDKLKIIKDCGEYDFEL